jgi:glycosyltransferase involved in cell wall biosynthesis
VPPMHDKRVLLALVETVPAGQKGSMSRYADLLESSLRESEIFSITRISLALPQSLLAKVPGYFSMWVHHGWIWLTARFRLHPKKFDLFHLLDGSHGYVIRWLPPEKTVVTAHDVIPLLQCRQVLGKRIPGRGSRMVIHAAIDGLRTSRQVICDSTRTMQDLHVHAEIPLEKMSVVFPALSAGDMLRTSESMIPWSQRRNGASPYILHLGHNGFYKNRSGVLRVFSKVYQLFPGIKLKLAGAAPNEAIKNLAKELGVAERIEYIVNPNDTEIAELYRHALLLLFPSLYEGFGWPPLEAMAFGTPVVCSDAGSLAEVVANAAMTAPATDEEKLAEHCLSILRDDELAGKMIEHGFQRITCFQPSKMAAELTNVYQKAVG